MKKLLALSVLGLFVSGGALHVHAAGGLDFSSIIDAMFQTNDKNGDGVIAKDEAHGKVADNFDAMDKNGDDKISEYEIEQYLYTAMGAE